jgi:acyl-CoA-binding protein
MLNTADLPDDVTALNAMLIAAQAREAAKDVQIVRKDERIERLGKLVAAFKQAAFGRKSED